MAMQSSQSPRQRRGAERLVEEGQVHDRHLQERRERHGHPEPAVREQLVKALRRSDRALKTLKSWKKTSVVKAIVRA